MPNINRNTKQHYIYRLTDPTTKEFYLGVRSCEGLCEEDDYMGSPSVWQPEDLNRLEKEVLVIFPTRKHANRMERFVIENFIDDELNRNHHIPNTKFYNDGSEEVNNKIRQAHLGKKLSKEHKQKISEAHKGKIVSKETRKKMSQYWKGKPLPKKARKNCIKARSKPVLQYDLDGNFIREWKNRTIPSNFLNILSSAISNCCNGRAKSAGGFIWRNKKGNKIVNKINEYLPDNKVKVLQLSLDEKIINEFDSIAEAKRFIGGGSICECCSGKYKTSMGFKWRYKNS